MREKSGQGADIDKELAEEERLKAEFNRAR
jgi:hypothetical protein